MEATALEVVNVTKRFGGGPRWTRYLPWRGAKKPKPPLYALNAVNLVVRQGEIYGIIGANGSGKSTLIRIISTLLLPDEGRISVFGLDVVRDAMAVRRLINRVSADPAFFRIMSAVENLLFFGRAYGLTPREVMARAPALLARLGLDWERAWEPMTNLSRGQQQKVAVARAFLTSPLLLLLDEPTTGLDPRSKREVQAFIREVRAEQGTTVLLTTHNMEEAELLSDRIGLLAGGQLVAEGTALELRQRIARRDGIPLEAVNMETVFMDLTGRSIEDDEEREREGEVIVRG